MRKLGFGLIPLFFLAAFLLVACSEQGREQISLFAAASLTDALDAVIEEFETANTGFEVVTNYGSSGTLANQILTSGGADVFVTASQASMNTVAELLEAGSRYDIVANRLVVIVHVTADLPAFEGESYEQQFQAFKTWLVDGNQRISIGDYVGSNPVPAGKYSYDTLGHDYIEGLAADGRVSKAANVREVLSQVASGAADIGFVYLSDANIEGQVKDIFELFPATPIVYPAALISESANKKGPIEFFAFLKTKVAMDILESFGFTAL